jgi:transcriptional regulator with XRE-family HTH domain
VLTILLTLLYKYRVRFGERVKSARIQMGLSLRQLAIQLNVSAAFLSYVEEGKTYPGYSNYRAFAGLLGISVDKSIDLITKEKAEDAKRKINGFPLFKKEEESRFLTKEEIERIALKDRNSFLTKVGRTRFFFPRDRNLIPQILYELTVVDDDVLFGIDNRKIYAGLFPRPFKYQGVENAIAVATHGIRKGAKDFVSEKTLTFHTLHEVGHYRLHWLTGNNNSAKQEVTDRPLECSQGDRSPKEFQANRYAVAFLMPREEIFTLLDGSKIINLTSDGEMFCDYFYVDVKTLENRLRDLGINIKY